MNAKNFNLASLVVIVSICVSACGPGQIFGPTMKPAPTNTPTQAPTNTSTPTNTATPTLSPTPTFPPTPTAIFAIGTPVASENWEVLVTDAITHSRMTGFFGNVYDAQEGFIYVEMGLKINNLIPEKTNFDTLLTSSLGDPTSVTFRILDKHGVEPDLQAYGFSARDIDPLYVEITLPETQPQSGNIFQYFFFWALVKDIKVEDATTLSIRLFLKVEKEVVDENLILQYQDVPLIEFPVRQGFD